MKIGILQTGDTPEELLAQYGNYDDMFMRLLEQNHAGFEFEVFRVLDGHIPEDVYRCDGWLITGSKFSVYGAQPWISPLKQFICHIVDADLPLVGICFGHQIIAEALGGRVEKSDKGWGLGLDTYSLEPDSMPNQPECITLEHITLNVFHQDQVVKLPPKARVFASSDFCQYAGLTIGDQVMTIQAHPEFRNDFNRLLLAERSKGIVPELQAHAAIQTLQQQDAQVDSDCFGSWISDFFTSHQISNKA